MSLPTPYFQDDAVTIYHGDCRELLPVLKADVVITDPPYGVGLGSHADAKEKRPGVGLKKQAYATYEDTPANFASVVVPVIQDAIARVDRALIFMAGTMMWDFPRPSAVSAVYLPSGQGRTCWGFQNLAHIMLYGTAPDLHLGAKNTALYSTDHSESNGHPCPKPLSWMRWAVSLASKPGETIVDPFMGSGTTLRAAKDLGRKAIGIEIEERYCEIAAKRMAQGVLL